MNEKPRIQIKTILLIGISILFLMLIMSGYAWKQIPEGEKIPVHWGVDGQPDRYGSKFEGLLLMPIICTGLIGMFCGIPFIEPRRFNLVSSQKAYQAIVIGLLLFMAVIHGVTIQAALNRNVEMNLVVSLGIGLLFLVIGNYMGKIRSNFFCGIRTPWTLSSELSWNKTHRLGGKLMMALGLLFMISPLLPGDDFPVFLVLGGVFGMVTVLVVYSFWIWKNDPDKQDSGR